MKQKEIELLLHKVNIISTSEMLEKTFRSQFISDWELIRAAIKDDVIKDDVIGLINKLVPTVFKVGGKLLLLGEVKKRQCDYVGDDLDKGDIIEIYDATTEMKTGESYSFYVSTTKYFPHASIDETIEVLTFMNTL